MATFRIDPSAHDLFENAVLLDTNVLVAAFDTRDGHNADALSFVEILLEQGKTIVIPVSVAIEAWGVLFSHTKGTRGGHNMLNWALHRASAIFVSDPTIDFHSVQQIASRIEVDLVDSLLFHLSQNVTKQCRFAPPIPIATYDSVDIASCAQISGAAVRILDPDTLEYLDILAR